MNRARSTMREVLGHTGRTVIAHRRPSRQARSARAGQRREWLWYSQVFLNLGCLLGWPPTRMLGCTLSMGGGILLLAGPRGISHEHIRAVWSSLRGRCPVALERELRACFRSLFEPRDVAARVELVESRFRRAARPSLPRLSARAASMLVRDLQSRYAEFGFTPSAAGLALDHVTVQLHFLGHLLELAATNGPESERAVQEALVSLRERLLPWLPALRAEVVARADGSFFAAVLATAEVNARAVETDLARVAARALRRERLAAPQDRGPE